MNYLDYSYTDMRHLAHDLVKFNLKPIIIISIIYLLINFIFEDNILITTLFVSIATILITTICTYSLASKKYSLNDFRKNSKQLVITSLKYFIVDLLMGIVVGIIAALFLQGTLISMHLTLANSFLFTIVIGILLIIIMIYVMVRISLLAPVLVMMPELKMMGAFKYALSLTKGRTMDIIMYFLTYIGWIILTLITLGIASIYVLPLLTAGSISYYLNVTGSPLEIN